MAIPEFTSPQEMQTIEFDAVDVKGFAEVWDRLRGDVHAFDDSFPEEALSKLLPKTKEVFEEMLKKLRNRALVFRGMIDEPVKSRQPIVVSPIFPDEPVNIDSVVVNCGDWQGPTSMDLDEFVEYLFTRRPDSIRTKLQEMVRNSILEGREVELRPSFERVVRHEV